MGEGDRIEAFYEYDRKWYPGTFVGFEADPKGKGEDYLIRYNDTTKKVFGKVKEHVRRLRTYQAFFLSTDKGGVAYKEGDRIEALEVKNALRHAETKRQRGV